MCGRFSQSKELKDILKRFQAELAEVIEVSPRYNIPLPKTLWSSIWTMKDTESYAA